uniref:Ubiquitin-like protease family profile domain-containing protein n=1 Tax=viral metagenome TaxID=1070528 RepID=A0A6C0K0I2_9ZZZZ
MYKTNRRNRRHRKLRKTHKKGGKNKMNCSPIVDNKTVNSSTCFTPDVLIKIKDAYNKSHSKDKYIPWSNPQEIWRTLNKRLVNCAKEDCWLSTIKDKMLVQELKDVIFAPKHPPDWLKNPNEWLTDLDISNVMEQYEKTYANFKFIGPSPIDFDTRVERGELPWADPGDSNDKVCVWEELCHLDVGKLLKSGITQLGIVFNLDKYDEPGSHWVSLYVSLGTQDKLKKNTGGKSNVSSEIPGSYANKEDGPSDVEEGPFLFYFDSTGKEAPLEIKALIKRIEDQCKQLSPPIKIQSYNNNGQDHQKSNTECGMYSLFFIITMLTNEMDDKEAPNGELKLDFDKKITLFRNATIPDKYVEIYRHKYFNKPE